MMYSGASITKVADKLLHKGYITRRENPLSRREKLIKVTPAGERIANKVLADVKKAFKPVVKGLTASERNQLLKFLKVLLDNVLIAKGVV
jgi:DNA-binding MarR family transcriptional regulator